MIDRRLPKLNPARSYSLTELAQRLGVNPKTVARYRIRGVLLANGERLRLPAFKLNGAYRISGRAALEWLSAQEGAGSRGFQSQATPAPEPRREQLDLVDAMLDAAGF